MTTAERPAPEPAMPAPVVIVGAGPAGRAAAAILPEARVVARPDATAWHAEPGRIWVEDASGVRPLAFARLLLCADEPLLLMALGCAFAGARPVVGAAGETSVAGIFAAGRILGAATAEEAAHQGRAAAAALAGQPTEGRIDPLPPSPLPLPDAPEERLDPLALAQVLEGPPGAERNRAALAQAAIRGPRLSGVVAPARPVGFAALAAMAPATVAPRTVQRDAAALEPAAGPAEATA